MAAKIADFFSSVFFLQVLKKFTLALKKGEALSEFAPDGFFGVEPFNVQAAGIFVPQGFPAENTNDWFRVFFRLFVRFPFVRVKVSRSFKKFAAVEIIAANRDLRVNILNVNSSSVFVQRMLAAVNAFGRFRVFLNSVFLLEVAFQFFFWVAEKSANFEFANFVSVSLF